MDGFDTTGDGVADGYVYDTSGNTVADVLAMDVDQNGVLESYGFDQDENGIAESYAVDANENGIAEVAAYDVDQNGVIDYQITDLNKNGVNDSAETYPSPTVAVIGPGVRPAVDNVYGLPFADAAQRVAFEGAMGYDSDSDGFTDPNDGQPYDRDRR